MFLPLKLENCWNWGVFSKLLTVNKLVENCVAFLTYGLYWVCHPLVVLMHWGTNLGMIPCCDVRLSSYLKSNSVEFGIWNVFSSTTCSKSCFEYDVQKVTGYDDDDDAQTLNTFSNHTYWALSLLI